MTGGVPGGVPEEAAEEEAIDYRVLGCSSRCTGTLHQNQESGERQYIAQLVNGRKVP